MRIGPRKIHVQQPWYDLITKGEYHDEFVGYKTIEGRPGAEGEFLAGEIVEIVCGSERVVFEIIKVIHYDTLYDYLSRIDYKKAAPHASSDEDATSKYLDVYYVPEGTSESVQVFSDERIRAKGGINSLYLRALGRLVNNR
jgi:ASC-1-like (ASCH) protein